MKLAILSDIQSNSFALEKVLDDITANGINRLLVAGDIFGYYPWASETWRLLQPYLKDSFFILGNHDMLLLKEPVNPPSYYKAAQLNRDELMQNNPEAMTWLRSLSLERTFQIENYPVRLIHGTPQDPLEGRYYPDSPEGTIPIPEGGVLILGHTHYPLVKITDGSMIINPGSTGQPRDGNPMPSWALWDTEKHSVQIKRTAYDNLEVMKLLTAMGWDERSVRALNKTAPGSLI